jgi:mono/diheme cytochrome c family protein
MQGRAVMIGIVVLLGLAGCAAPPSPGELELQGQIADGRAVAERECATCHALDQSTASPRADAPPMRDLLARYEKDALANDLIEGIKLGHQDMPQFDFNVIAADALIAYLKSIQPE